LETIVNSRIEEMDNEKSGGKARVTATAANSIDYGGTDGFGSDWKGENEGEDQVRERLTDGIGKVSVNDPEEEFGAKGERHW
jgi:hypothetical protein